MENYKYWCILIFLITIYGLFVFCYSDKPLMEGLEVSPSTINVEALNTATATAKSLVDGNSDAKFKSVTVSDKASIKADGSITGTSINIPTITTKKIDGSPDIQAGAMYTKGGTNANCVGCGSHFPYTDGINYIRGDTVIDGNISLNGQIKIGGDYWIYKQGNALVIAREKDRTRLPSLVMNPLYGGAPIRIGGGTGGNLCGQQIDGNGNWQYACDKGWTNIGNT